MFAGPNGSGKSSLKGVLPAGLQGIYLNPDDLEHDLGKRGFLDLNEYGFPGIAADALQYILKSHFLQQAFSRKELSALSADGSILHLGGLVPNSYLASVLCDFLRQGLLRGGLSFTFETVMSHPGKVAILAQAQNSGYRTYLYYVATEDPSSTSPGWPTGSDLEDIRFPPTRSGNATIVRWSFSFLQSGTQTALTFSTIQERAQIKRGSPRSPKDESWNSNQIECRHGSKTP